MKGESGRETEEREKETEDEGNKGETGEGKRRRMVKKDRGVREKETEG